MAIFTYSGAADMSGAGFAGLFTDPNISATSTARQIGQTPALSNYIYNWQGSGFTYDGAGRFTNGAVTGFSGVDSGDTDFSVTGLDILATSVQSRLTAANGPGLIDLLTVGHDEINGSAFSDNLFGGFGRDTIRGGLGQDTIDGGTNFDTVDYSDRQDAGVSVNVINGTAFTGGFINASGFYQGGALEDTLLNLENIVGSDFGDRLVAGSTSASVEGRGGNDFLFTFSGNDTLFGGDGGDFISAGQSSDQLNGEAGNDTLNGGTGFDTLDGGANSDTADYSDRSGAVSVNLVSGFASTGGALNGSGLYSGGFTEDQLISVENVTGSAFGDRLVGAAGGSTISGGGGGDSIASFAGNDTIIGGDGDDTIDAGDGQDRFLFSAGHDDDVIFGFDSGAGAGDVIKFFGMPSTFDTFLDVILASVQVFDDVLINLPGGDSILLKDTLLLSLNANDFEFG